MVVLKHTGSILNDHDFKDMDPVCELKDGDYFGEVSVLTGHPHTVTAMATSYCILNVLTSTAFDKLEAEYSGFLLALMKSAHQYIDNVQGPPVETSWKQIAQALMDKFGDIGLAFQGLCGADQGDVVACKLLTLEAFKKSVISMGYSKYVALTLWAQCREDNTCTMTLKSFREVMNRNLPSRQQETQLDIIKEASYIEERIQQMATPTSRSAEVEVEATKPQIEGIAATEDGIDKALSAVSVASTGLVSASSKKEVVHQQSSPEAKVPNARWSAMVDDDMEGADPSNTQVKVGDSPKVDHRLSDPASSGTASCCTTIPSISVTRHTTRYDSNNSENHPFHASEGSPVYPSDNLVAEPRYTSEQPVYPSEMAGLGQPMHDEEPRGDSSQSMSRLTPPAHASHEFEVVVSQQVSYASMGAEEAPSPARLALLSSLSRINERITKRKWNSKNWIREKYCSASCSDIEVDARVQTDRYEMETQLKRILHVIGPQPCISYAGRAGVIYQKAVKWMSSMIIALALFRASIPSSCRNEATIWVTFMHHIYFIISFIYIFLALPCRLLFTVVNFHSGQEWSSPAVIRKVLMHTTEIRLDFISSLGFLAEVILWASNVDYSMPWRLGILGSRILCGWHVVMPVQRVTTERVHLAAEAMTVLLKFFMAVHIIACVWALLGNLEHDIDVVNWAAASKHASSCDMYVASFYFIGYTLTTTGYGDIVPANEFEQVGSVVLMILGTFMIAQVRATLSWTTATCNCKRFEYTSKVSRIASALECLGIDGVLSSRVFALLEYTNLCYVESEVLHHLDKLSAPLRAEFRVSRYDVILKQCRLFADLNRDALHFFVHRLQDAVYLPNDYVYAEGDTPNDMYIVRSGIVGIESRQSAAILRDPNRPNLDRSFSGLQLHYAAGDYFGEIGVFSGQPRTITASAHCYCVLSSLSKASSILCSRKSPMCLSPC
jgi:CRP-like cAMP-binding protein